MADIELVIKIPERDYYLACKYSDALIAAYAHYIKEGTLLPKGHGDLVDTTYFEHYLRDTYIDSVSFKRAISAMKRLPTIIEADKE